MIFPDITQKPQVIYQLTVDRLNPRYQHLYMWEYMHSKSMYGETFIISTDESATDH